jgi:hypothetical protein
MKNLSHHTDLCELETSLLMRGIQVGEMSKLGSLSMLYGLIPCVFSIRVGWDGKLKVTAGYHWHFYGKYMQTLLLSTCTHL